MNADDIEDFSSVYVLMRKVAIPNIDVKAWKKIPQREYVRSLMQHEIRIQRPFELTVIEYNAININLQQWNNLITTLLLQIML